MSETRKWVTIVSWDDVPHLPTEFKEAMKDMLLPHERGPRVAGVPEKRKRRGRQYRVMREGVVD